MNPDRHDPGTVRAALAYVDPNVARKEWAKVAFALKSELGEDGFTLFDEWSQGGQTYKVKEVRSAWKSAKAGGSVTIGTLFSMASAGGFRLADHVKAEKPTNHCSKARYASPQNHSDRKPSFV